MNHHAIQSAIQLFCRTISITFLMSVSPVFAADGVLEINQACVAAGCFPGDSAGFPVKITDPGSYILTSDIDISGENTPEDLNAIEIQGALGRVVLDLNGFSIVGPTFCSGGTPPTSCSPLGTGVGIRAFDNTVIIRNGRVTGMGNIGIQLVTASTVEGVVVTDCGGVGIQGGTNTVISDSRVRRNGSDGINVSTRSLLLRNMASGNIGLGVSVTGNVGYGLNSITNNTGGTIDGGVQIANNMCDGDLTCP